MHALPSSIQTKVINSLQNGAAFLDSGCCFGQEIRYLVHSYHIPATQLYGFDLEPRFTNFGYELFRDRGSLNATFLSGDITAAPESSGAGDLDSLVGRMDIVFASSFLHVWDWDDMMHATKRLVSFLKPRPGSMVVGRQLGSLVAGSHAMPTKTGCNYRHNVESMRRFWEQIGREMNMRWTLEGGLYEGEETIGNQGASWSEPNMRMLWFMAVRVA